MDMVLHHVFGKKSEPFNNPLVYGTILQTWENGTGTGKQMFLKTAKKIPVPNKRRKSLPKELLGSPNCGSS
jgi:hypothetical protein